MTTHRIIGKFFRKMQTVLVQHPNQDGMNEARFIWKSIHGGMGSWNEDYIPHDQVETMRELNAQLEDACTQLSALLQMNVQDGSFQIVSTLECESVM